MRGLGSGKDRLVVLASLGAGALLWELGTRRLSPAVAAPFSATMSRLWEMTVSGELPTTLVGSLVLFAVGLGLAVVVALPLGLFDDSREAAEFVLLHPARRAVYDRHHRLLTTVAQLRSRLALGLRQLLAPLEARAAAAAAVVAALALGAHAWHAAAVDKRMLVNGADRGPGGNIDNPGFLKWYWVK